MAEEKKKKPPVDYTVFKKDHVLPMEDLSKNQLKTMKVCALYSICSVMHSMCILLAS